MQIYPYRELVGRLTNISRICRPDIAFAVGVLNRFLHNPGLIHWKAALRLLKYLSHTSNYRLRLAPLLHTSSPIFETLTLTGLSDADFGNGPEAKSTTGYCFFLGGALISWSSKLQITTASSSTYAEIIALYHTLCEGLWARQFLSSINHSAAMNPTAIGSDNLPAIDIITNHRISPRSKHFDTKYHFLREKLLDHSITLPHLAGSNNTADVFTKPLSTDSFRRHHVAPFAQTGFQIEFGIR